MLIRDSGWRFIDASSFSDEKSRALSIEGGEDPKRMEKISVPMDKPQNPKTPYAYLFNIFLVELIVKIGVLSILIVVVR